MIIDSKDVPTAAVIESWEERNLHVYITTFVIFQCTRLTRASTRSVRRRREMRQRHELLGCCLRRHQQDVLSSLVVGREQQRRINVHARGRRRLGKEALPCRVCELLMDGRDLPPTSLGVLVVSLLTFSSIPFFHSARTSRDCARERPRFVGLLLAGLLLDGLRMMGEETSSWLESTWLLLGLEEERHTREEERAAAAPRSCCQSLFLVLAWWHR